MCRSATSGRQGAFAGAQGFYTLSNGDLQLVEKAKERGLFVAHEQIINPHVGLILREERARFPGLEPQEPEEAVRAGIGRDTAQWRLADVVIAASEFVRGEIEEHGIPRARVALVPYGVSEDWLSVQPRPTPGRILFVGTVGLRKGSHYLASATRLLRERRVPHEVRVVGPFDPKLIGRQEFSGPHYVGQVPRATVRDEFARASIFVLPTLAESFGLVHLEAMACGLPVITTPNCGSLVRDGVDGYVVPIRDVEALADRIEALLRDESLRMRMSASARARAAAFTWARYGEALISSWRPSSSKRRVGVAGRLDGGTGHHITVSFEPSGNRVDVGQQSITTEDWVFLQSGWIAPAAGDTYMSYWEVHSLLKPVVFYADDCSLEESDGCTITGVVKDNSGNAVVAATVQLIQGGTVLKTATSIAGGAYTFGVGPLAGQTYELERD